MTRTPTNSTVITPLDAQTLLDAMQWIDRMLDAYGLPVCEELDCMSGDDTAEGDALVQDLRAMLVDALGPAVLDNPDDWRHRMRPVAL